MKVGILNLTLDNNYGGNLQRYALIRVIQDLGGEPVHINLRRSYKISKAKKILAYAYRFAKKCIGKHKRPINLERYLENKYNADNKFIYEFYERYVPHTEIVYDVSGIKEVCKANDFDAIIVGSDQVWREDMTRRIGIENYMLKFSEGMNVKRIAYGVSIGNETPFAPQTIPQLKKFYDMFDAVSVREPKAIELFNSYGWSNPKAEWVLDPTMLLVKEDYVELINQSSATNVTKDKIFCYVLDDSAENEAKINEAQKRHQREVVRCGLKDTAAVSIEQWLSNILNCELMITDSYHGVVFSLIFNKPFIYLGNVKRGNLRVDTLFEKLLNNADTTNADWPKVNDKISSYREKSINFLEQNLKV